MKKTLLFAIMAGAALAGCVKNEEVAMSSGGSPERISFEAPVVSVPTRATEIFGNYPKDKDFAVYALYHVGNFSSFDANGTSLYMNNVTCTANKTGEGETPDYWAPATDYYWPKTENSKLTFAGYAPAGMATLTAESSNEAVGVKWNATGFTFQNFVVNNEPTEQIDLLYSERQYNKQNIMNDDNIVTDKPYDGVTIPFKHALSSILFKVKTAGNYIVYKTNESGEETEEIDEEKSTFIKLVSLTVNNVAKKGTFVQNLKSDTSGDNDTNTTDNKNLEPAWTTTIDATNPLVDYAVFPKKDASEEEKTKEIYETSDYVNGDVDSENDKYDNINPPSTPNGTTVGENTYTNDGVRRSDLILIPQSLDRGDGVNDKVTVTIEYTTKTGNGTEVRHKQKFNLVVKDNDKDGNAETVWEMGKRYIYDISIGLDKIYFNATVLNWVDDEGDVEVATN